MPLPIALVVTGLTGLASTILKTWGVLESSKQKRLDRAHLSRLQEKRLRHDLLVAKIKSGDVLLNTHVSVLESLLVARLRIEAELLDTMGFDVVFEPVGTGYGLALPVWANLTYAFWIPSGYPHQAPDVFIATESGIDRISFGFEAWQPHITLADVVSALGET